MSSHEDHEEESESGSEKEEENNQNDQKNDSDNDSDEEEENDRRPDNAKERHPATIFFYNSHSRSPDSCPKRNLRSICAS
jgi:hypothetical protein